MKINNKFKTVCDSLTQEERMRVELPVMGNRLADGLVIFLIVP